MSCTRLGIKRIGILAVAIVLLLSASFCDAGVVWTPSGVELRGIGAPVGYRYVNVLTPDETPQPLKNVFSIKQVAPSPPRLDSLDPTSGTMGTRVALSGKHFGTSRGHSYVTFNGIEAYLYDSWSDGKIVCQVPEGATSGPVKVTTSLGTSNEKEFTVGEPKILDVSPKSIHPGDAGANIHILGEYTHFEQGASAAIFSGTGITVNSTEVADSTHVTANISVDMNAPTGFRDVNVITLPEAPEPLANHFIVVATTPAVTTTEVSSITAISASSGGDVTSDGGASVTARGVCWRTSTNPTISNSHTTDGTGTGSFPSSITGLIPGTTYHVRAYATNSAGTGYGSDVTFKTFYASTLYVSLSGECGDKTPCYDSIQEAIDAASTVELILIAQGTYDESIVLNEPKALTLQGGWDSTFTTQSSNTVINSLTITGTSGTVEIENMILQ